MNAARSGIRARTGRERDDDGQQKEQVRRADIDQEESEEIEVNSVRGGGRNRENHGRFGRGHQCVADSQERRRENEIEERRNWQRQAEVTFGWKATQCWSS